MTIKTILQLLSVKRTPRRSVLTPSHSCNLPPQTKVLENGLGSVLRSHPCRILKQLLKILLTNDQAGEEERKSTQSTSKPFYGLGLWHCRTRIHQAARCWEPQHGEPRQPKNVDPESTNPCLINGVSSLVGVYHFWREHYFSRC